MCSAWFEQVPVATASGVTAAQKLRQKYYDVVDDVLGNDDLLGVRSLAPTPGHHHFEFKRDEYDYAVTFAITD